jgi:hypothetical protein
LVDFYVSAIREEYGIFVRVKEDKYKKFAAREAELLAKGHSPKQYAHSIARYWHNWCDEREFGHLPINIFLGPKSLNWYEHYAMFGVDIVSPSEYKAWILADEYNLACFFINTLLLGADLVEVEAIEYLRLSEHWHQANADGNRPKTEVAKAIAEMRGVECLTNDYGKLAEAIHDRQVRLESAVQRKNSGNPAG